MNTPLRIGKTYKSQLPYITLIPAFFVAFSFLYNPFGMKEYYQAGGMDFGFHFIILTVIQTIDAYVLSPKLLNRSITLHPLLVIAAVIRGGAVGGIGGMVLGIPVLAFFKMQFDRYIERRERMQGIAGEEAPAPEE